MEDGSSNPNFNSAYPGKPGVVGEVEGRVPFTHVAVLRI